VASWLVVGCGYVGAALAARLACAGEDVVVTRRTAAAAQELERRLGVPALQLDLAAGAPLPARALSSPFVICLAPPGAHPAAEIAQLCALAARKLVYVSSTGVYAPAAGALVDETWPIAPATASGRARAAAEAALAAHARVPYAVLRAAGIYGPGRGLSDRLRAGSYRIVGDGSGHVARIHVEDLVTAIARAATTDITGAINVADDDPAPIGTVADALAAHLGLPPPPRVPAASVDPEIAGMLTADRRIANRRLRDELGVRLRYPSWRAQLDATAS
jgi:nucleoside-diphosphate-sugar epimerase